MTTLAQVGMNLDRVFKEVKGVLVNGAWVIRQLDRIPRPKNPKEIEVRMG